MRVAIFSDNDFDTPNGITTTLKAVLRYAPPMWQPRIYTAAECGMASESWFVPSSLRSPIPWHRDMPMYVPRVRRFARELQREGVDLIHLTTPGPVGLAGRWLARRLRVPVVASYHAHYGEHVRTLTGSAWLAQMTDDYTNWVYASSRTVLVPSRSTRAALIDQGYSADRLRLWPRGVDAEQFSPARSSVEMRRRWGIDDRRLAILYAGRLAVDKGLRLIVPIRRELFRRGIEHRFIFAGDGPLMNELRERCPDSYFLGTVPQGQVAIAMASADLFLYPGESDAFGHVVLEAQASGLPVLVSDRGGPAEQVIPDGTGAVCPAGDVTAFVDQIVRLRHPIGRRSMSVAARQYALSRDWPDALRPLFRTWREAITAHVSRARGFELVGRPHDRSLTGGAAQSR